MLKISLAIQYNRKILKINPSKFKAWTLACVRLGPACGAAAALTASLAIATWYFDSDLGRFVGNESVKSYIPSVDKCPTTLLVNQRFEGSTNPYAPPSTDYVRLVNCFEDAGSVVYFITPNRLPEFEAWQTPGLQPALMPLQKLALGPNPAWNGNLNEPKYETINSTYWRYRRNVALASAPQVQVGVKTEPTPEQIVEKLSENPLAWQLSPGEFPDIFDAPSASENPATDPDSLPIQDYVGGQPSTADLIDMSAVANQTFNVAEYLDHDSFLPSECPQPMVFNISQTSFTITFDTLCNYAVIIRPFIVFSGLILWLVIVWRGLSL